MSAIAGLVSLEGRPIERDRLGRMAKAAEIFGPDGVYLWNAGSAGFAYLKLSTTPESINEQQPLADDEAQLVIVFDGRLDNREEIFNELDQKTSPPRDAGDGVLALAMYKQFGDRCPEKLVGDYAFAIWNIKERRLFCARSLLGWRPFLWWCDGKTFGFATEVKQLFAGGGIEPAPNEPMLGEILSLKMTHATDTIWKNIYRLQPGTAMSVQQNGTPRIWNWHTGPFPEIKFRSDQEYAERFRELFDQALKAVLRSTTPIFVQLSGGLDSSSVVCRSAELYRKGAVEKLVQPISAVFPGKTHDESKWIDMVGEKSGVQSKRFTPEPYKWDEHIAWAGEHMHLPLRPNANLMDTLASKLPEYGSRVLLTGEGGDDWLVGSFSHYTDLLRQGRVIQLIREGLILNNHGNYLARLRRTAGNSLGPLFNPQLKKMAIYGSQFDEDVPEWIMPEWSTKIGLRERVRPTLDIPGLTNVAQLRRYQRYLSIRHHVIFDNAYHRMASHNIEIRHPLHDRRLTEFILRCPGHMLRRGERKKHILREAMKGILPEGIRQRTTKAAFFDPYVDAMAEYLSTRPVSELAPVKNRWVDGKIITDVFDKNLAAKQKGLSGGVYPPSLGPLWFAIALDIWMRNSF